METPRLIPEWHPNEACWLAWPNDKAEWLGDLEAPRRAVAKLIAAIIDIEPDESRHRTGTDTPDMPPSRRTRGEDIHLLIFEHPEQENPRDAYESAQALLHGLPIHYHHVPYGDIWLRDTGPIFLARANSLVAACFAWNGWGGEYLFPHDDRVAERIAALAHVNVEKYDFVLEGGAIESDGQGTVLTTRQCLLNPNRHLRNAGSRLPTEADIERKLATAVGAKHVIWLDRGLENDHTDGHIDTLARFVAPGRVVCMRATGPGAADDPNRTALAQIATTLRNARDARGQALDVIEIPSPGRIVGPPDCSLMPASYVNFYLGNTSVVVPTYGSRHDAAATAAIAELFPTRRTIGVDARAIIAGGGAFHCITKEQPALPL